jgi:hypothetical protein
MTQGRIERYHRSMKSAVRLENHYNPWELGRAVARLVAYYNHERLREAIGNVAPDSMHHGRRREIPTRRKELRFLAVWGSFRSPRPSWILAMTRGAGWI